MSDISFWRPVYQLFKPDEPLMKEELRDFYVRRDDSPVDSLVNLLALEDAAANPLLLTILALIHRNGTQMPQRRVELYALATKTLIEDWQLGRNAPYGTRQRQLVLVEEEVTALLAPLAFRMHEEKPSGLVTQAEVEAWLTPKMAELQGVDESAALELVRQFLRKVRETTGLFVERAPGVYGFMHLTFEEYFAARHIADNESSQVLAIIQSKMSDARWEEPILLALSFLNAHFPQQSKILVESLFRDLIQLGEALHPKRKNHYLSSLKVNLIKIESKLSRKTDFRIVVSFVNFFIQTLLWTFNSVLSLPLLRYINQFFFDSDYLEKLNLALQIVQDIELNIPQRLKLIRGLLAAKILIDNLNPSFPKLPDRFSKLFQEVLMQVKTLKQFSSKLLKKSENLRNLGLIESVLEYLKIVSCNLSQSEWIRNKAQIIFFEVASAHANSLSENSDNISDNIVESLNLPLPEKYQAVAYWQAGYAYQQQNKYKQAIAHYEQSRDLYQQLEQQQKIANLWYNLADCYRAWGKYELALEAGQRYLAIGQQLENQTNIAHADWQLGRIYQTWGKYAQAIAHYEQSRDLWQQLEQQQEIANLWYNLADCYRAWGKYELALEAGQQELAIRQRLEDQPNIADAYNQLGRIYQAWGKYEQALTYYQQSRDLYQQLGQETNVANQWYRLADCDRDWGKYEQALEAQQQELAIRQRLDDQPNIADAYYQLGRIYQAWGKYEEALTHHQQSRDLYGTLDLQQNVANQLSWLADCYRESKDYTTAIEYYQNSFERHQALGHNESSAKRLRQLSNTQRQLAKNCSREEATALLQQAEHHLQQAIQLDTAGDYRENLAYDHIALALLFAQQLRWLPENDASMPNRIAQFEQCYATGFAGFSELGQAADNAEAALDIARAYLEISPLENLDRAEALAHQSLQTFQDFNRRKLEAAASKLLGEIYLARTDHQESGAVATASQFLNASLRCYRELGLTEKAAEVEQLMSEYHAGVKDSK